MAGPSAGGPPVAAAAKHPAGTPPSSRPTNPKDRHPEQWWRSESSESSEDGDYDDDDSDGDDDEEDGAGAAAGGSRSMPRPAGEPSTSTRTTGAAGRGLKPKAPEEEDPLYDPDADDLDTVCMDRERQGRVSDAILSCPACFATLCIDCQQHELYPTQFRAMFVTSCRVDRDQPREPVGSRQRRRGRGKGDGGGAKRHKEDEYYAVLCDVCDTEVGVQDRSDGCYHFFHVYPSNA